MDSRPHLVHNLPSSFLNTWFLHSTKLYSTRQQRQHRANNLTKVVTMHCPINNQIHNNKLDILVLSLQIEITSSNHLLVHSQIFVPKCDQGNHSLQLLHSSPIKSFLKKGGCSLCISSLMPKITSDITTLTVVWIRQISC